jgi:cytochrome c oxidase assembly protein subunit 15
MNRKIIIWLAAGCFLVFMMVIIGGITRLTGSGLSITEWKLVRGTIPPLNEAQWQEEFENYKQIPQYRELNYDYSLADFKAIYFWEYLHRLIGRLIGVVFIIPFLYFYFTKQLNKPLLKKLLFIFFLGGFQGFLGWYMVKSGLVNNIRVSHLRLAAHLITAFITYGFIFWVMLDYWFKVEGLRFKVRSEQIFILLLIIIQIIYGAFTAGLKAGHIYNTFPKMGDAWIPEAVTYGLQTEGIGSLINNIACVQFVHRIVAWSLVIVIIIYWLKTRKIVRSNANSSAERQLKAMNFLMLAVIIQFLLGMFTLLYNVPIILGVLHQVGAFALFTAGEYNVMVSRYDDVMME